MDQKKKVCHNHNEIQNYHITAKDHRPFNFILSVHDVFIARKWLLLWTILSQYPAGLSGIMNKNNAEKLNVSNLCVRLLMMTRVCFHIQYVRCIFHVAWPQFRSCSRSNVNSFFFFFFFVTEAQEFILWSEMIGLDVGYESVLFALLYLIFITWHWQTVFFLYPVTV